MLSSGFKKKRIIRNILLKMLYYTMNFKGSLFIPLSRYFTYFLYQFLTFQKLIYNFFYIREIFCKITGRYKKF